jgi:hypothetical protein
VARLSDDLEQAKRMWTLRIKIDVWSKGKVAESVRQHNRELLRDEYLQLPRRRVWLYLKYARFAVLHVHYKLADDDDPLSGPEDVVVQGMLGSHPFPDSSLESNVADWQNTSSRDHPARPLNEAHVHRRYERH